jgi:hypothetical protein
MIYAADHGFYAAVERCPFSPILQGNYVLFTADGFCACVCKRSGVVMVPSNAAVVAIRRLLERFELASFDEDFVLICSQHVHDHSSS